MVVGANAKMDSTKILRGQIHWKYEGELFFSELLQANVEQLYKRLLNVFCCASLCI